MSFEDTVDKTLVHVGHSSSGVFAGLTDAEAKAALLAAHEAEVERIIGEDDKTVDIPDFAISRLFAEAYSLGVGAGRNALRAEQRRRAGITQPESTGGD